MKTIQTVFLSLFILLMASVSFAQVPELIRNSQFRKDARAAVDSLYNFNPKGADQKLAPWKQAYPSHPLWKLMDGMEFWWNILSDLDDTSHDKTFLKMMREADYAASKLLYKQSGHIDALIIRAVANGYIARQYSNRDEWVTSLSAARKAYSSYGYLQDADVDLADLKMGEGLKLYYSAYLPEAYPAVKTVSWFLPDGDKQQGLKYLREAAKTAIFARGEAIYFLGNINYNYEKKYDKALQNFQTLYDTYPNNNYYARLLVKNYYKMGRYDEALRVINESLARWSEKDLAFENVLREELLFWKGRILYRNNEYDEAASFFEQSLQLSKKLPRTRYRDFYAASAYYSGSVLQSNGDEDEAARYFKIVLDAKTGDGYKKMARRKLQNIRAEQQ